MTNVKAAMRIASFVSKALLVVGIMGLTALCGFLIGPVLETKYMPVVRDVQVVDVSKDEDAFTSLHIRGRKVRGCKFLAVNALTGDELFPEKATVRIPKYDGGSRPAGMQDFGVWEFEPRGHFLKLVVTHSCHALWDTTTELYERHSKTQ